MKSLAGPSRRRRRQNRELRGNQTEDRNRSKRQEQRQKGGRTTCYIFHLLICCRRRKIRKHIESRFVCAQKRKRHQTEGGQSSTMHSICSLCGTLRQTVRLSDCRTYCRTIGRTVGLSDGVRASSQRNHGRTLSDNCRTLSDCRTVG